MIVDNDAVFRERPRVRKYTLTKLMWLLHDNVEHDEPRSDVDWLTAETFIQRNISDLELVALSKQFLVLSGYESLRRQGADLPCVRYDLLEPVFDDYPKRAREVTSALAKIPRKKFVSVVNGLTDQEKDSFLDLILGRSVWEMYQSLKRSELLIEGGYGRVIT